MRIQEKAMQVYLSIALPGNTITDAATTKEIQAEKNLSEESGEWRKKLYPPEYYKPLSELSGLVRNWHYKRTFEMPSVIPADDDASNDPATIVANGRKADGKQDKEKGWRILTGEFYFPYTRYMREQRRKFDALRDEFIVHWSEVVAWAKAKHNGTFDPALYANPGRVYSKFKFRIDIQPIASGEDFRVCLNNEENDRIQKEIEERANTIANSAMTQLWKRLAAPLGHMSDILSRDNTKIYDSLLTNVQEIVDLAPALNLTGNPEVARICDEIKQTILAKATNIDALKEEGQNRDEIAKKAKEIYSKMSGYFS